MTFRRTLLMCSIAGVVLNMTGCADPQTRASLKEWGITVPASPLATANQSQRQYPQPPSAEVGSFKNDVGYDWLVGMYVSQGRDDDEQLDRAARAYKDVQEEMEMRLRAGFTPDQVRTALIAMVKARVAGMPKVPSPYYMTMPRIDGPLQDHGSVFVLRADRTVAVDRTAIGARVDYTQPYKYGYKHSKTASGSMGMMLSVFGSRYKGKQLINAAELSARGIETLTGGTITPEQALAMQRTSADGKLWAVVAGGYLSADQIKCNDPAPDTNILACSFVTTGQNMAPVNVVGSKRS